MNFRVVIMFFYLTINFLIIECYVDWRNLTSKLKDKVKTAYKKKLPKFKESISVGPSTFSALDYPKNVEILNAVRNLWNEYYECLQTKYSMISEEKTVSPYAVAAFTKTFIQLDCNICVSPEDISEEIEWLFVDKPAISKPVVVEEDEYKQISGFSLSLHFSDLQPFHQGMYYCHLKNDRDAPYFLHVLESSTEPITEVKSNSPKGPYPQKPVQIKYTNISVWNDWTTWTECSICGRVGKRTRIGYCKVSLSLNLPDDVKSNLTPSREVLNISSLVVQETERLLKYFVFGIPCRSLLLPTEFRNNFLINNFSTEIASQYCKVSCPSSVIFEVLDKDGQIIDRVNNTAKFYSIYQEIPPQPISFQLVIVYAKLDHNFVISCPNLRYKDTPVQWSVGGKIWIKENVEIATKNRIRMNDLNEIIFVQVKDIDINKIYSCFQLNERVGAVELKVEVESSHFQDYIDGLTLYAKVMILCIVFTFAYVSFRMCLNREKAAAGQYIPLRKELTMREFLIKMYHDTYIGEISE